MPKPTGTSGASGHAGGGPAACARKQEYLRFARRFVKGLVAYLGCPGDQVKLLDVGTPDEGTVSAEATGPAGDGILRFTVRLALHEDRGPAAPETEVIEVVLKRTDTHFILRLAFAREPFAIRPRRQEDLDAVYKLIHDRMGRS